MPAGVLVRDIGGSDPKPKPCGSSAAGFDTGLLLAEESEVAMVIGFLQADISIPGAQSLKDKRMVLRSLKDRALNKMNVSVAEVDKQDLWQAAVLAFVTVAAEKETVEKRLADIADFLRSDPRYVLLDYFTRLM